jgi:cyclopropane-fatty-acyl-phospholipid synthase
VRQGAAGGSGIARAHPRPVFDTTLSGPRRCEIHAPRGIVACVQHRLARAAMLQLLRRLRAGRLEVVEAGRRRGFGPPGAELRAEVTIRDPAAWAAPLRGSLGLGEGYGAGLWDTDDLVGLMRIGARAVRPRAGLQARATQARGWLHRVRRLVPENTRPRARAHIAAHYDLGNELFAAFLDPRMTYSCAYFPHPGADLETAQLAKLDRICRRLRLSPADHLLEIGTGWGGLAIHAAAEYGCRVTTTTISREQHALARQRVAEAGLEGRVEVLLEDYRDLRGRFDKLVSVEMIEAVGWQYFEPFFRRCSELLSPDGLMLLQAITIDDRLYESEKGARSFANTHIFPGGCLPSAALIARCIAAQTDLRPIWAEDMTAHYPLTLAAWRRRFLTAWDELAARGYDEHFKRLWVFYLSSSEAGFRERRLGDLQLLYAKPEWRGDDIAETPAAAAETPQVAGAPAAVSR